ncbi:hypothetical protein HZI73_20300 [Vallitalea pronyensis]|uniref:NADPH-dependent FMN reductase-like domain-containing protein n=1 Tax=Vallitalea pronyensis TaxID=1348613 RepID=A0A8J8MNK2_9FIRM|nr:NAD(P)H-dependent oxidoreductase [Vallitalea pronyensis]QUI24498.1 hypothetical protein HZI73_20300 [Vallitalea pronyensis]
MLNSKNALLLIGSPKKNNSTSASLGSYLIGKLELEGFTTEKIKIASSLKTKSGIEKLLQAVDNSEIIILSSPTYVDSLPAGAIKSFELIAEHRDKRKLINKQKIMFIANCGFPQALHNDVALDICKCFASHAGFICMGSLALGAGGAIRGRRLEDLGGKVRNIIKALDITAAALNNDTSIPLEAVELMKKPVIPPRIYTVFASLILKKRAKKFGAKKYLYSKPYEV